MNFVINVLLHVFEIFGNYIGAFLNSFHAYLHSEVTLLVLFCSKNHFCRFFLLKILTAHFLAAIKPISK